MIEQEKELEEVYKSLNNYYDGILKNVRDTIMDVSEELNVPFSYLKAGFDDLVDGCSITSKLKITDKPSGKKQNEDCEYFKDIHVDQWSVGESGDSFEGFIYARFQFNKWLKIPYEC
jgi:hypothetical protein